jgi:hypothetical protein
MINLENDTTQFLKKWILSLTYPFLSVAVKNNVNIEKYENGNIMGKINSVQEQILDFINLESKNMFFNIDATGVININLKTVTESYLIKILY